MKSPILIETPRLYMREFIEDDAQAVLFFNTREVNRYTGDAGLLNSIDDALQVIRNVWQKEYKKYGYARYALVQKSDDKVIGFCGLKFEPDLQAPDIGYRMHPDYWGKGYATEAVQATLEYGRKKLRLKNIVGEVHVDNVASQKVLLKCGMQEVDRYEKYGESLIRYK